MAKDGFASRMMHRVMGDSHVLVEAKNPFGEHAYLESRLRKCVAARPPLHASTAPLAAYLP